MSKYRLETVWGSSELYVVLHHVVVWCSVLLLLAAVLYLPRRYLLLAAGAKLAKPKLSAGYAHWRQDWQAGVTRLARLAGHQGVKAGNRLSLQSTSATSYISVSASDAAAIAGALGCPTARVQRSAVPAVA